MWERLTLVPLQKAAWLINLAIGQGFGLYYRRKRKRMPDFRDAGEWGN